MAASTFGIEEEYFLTDLASRCVAQRGVEAFAISSRRALGQRVTREMFAAQFEVVTPVLNSLDEARDCLGQARKTMADLASEFGCGILAAGTHPLGQWRSVQATNMARYRAIFDDYRIVASRSVLAGLHVHVGVPEGVDRIRLMNRLTPWLPLLLGLSASSPFWDGRPCGLMSYRQAVC
ncbi:MAG: carboxylate--amine ligase, partial [Pseudomonas sp.]|nr:carboxylate--amine ligase [Pseudomonas sp.]